MTNRIRAFFEERMRPPVAGNGGNGSGEAEESRSRAAGEASGEGSGEASGEASGADAVVGPGTERPLHLAACALLMELAHADDEFSEAEATHIEVVLRRHFDLDEDEARQLMELAEEERNEAIDLWQFTSLIRSSYDLGQKTLLAEIMWGLILADGEIARHEAWLLRKIANLLDLEPGYLSQARKRVSGDERDAKDERGSPGDG